MSDIFWVGLIAALSGLLGAAISGIVTFRATKRQTDAQLENTKNQIAHQAGEARRDRMIEARKGHLLSLRESMSLLFGAHSTSSSLRIGLQLGMPQNDPEGQLNMATDFERQRQIIRSETIKIGTIRPQISDPALISIVDELTHEIGAIVMQDTALGEPLTTTVDRFAGLEGLRAKLPAFNKRIEELLAGDDLAE